MEGGPGQPCPVGIVCQGVLTCDKPVLQGRIQSAPEHWSVLCSPEQVTANSSPDTAVQPRGSAAHTELWEPAFAKWKLILKTDPQGSWKAKQKERAVLGSTAAPFFSSHGDVQWDSCVPVLQGHQGPLVMVEIMSFLCSARDSCCESGFVHQVQACQAHKRNKAVR